jgi:hypothetical protein
VSSPKRLSKNDDDNDDDDEYEDENAYNNSR